MNLRCSAAEVQKRLAPIHPLDEVTAERLQIWTELLDKWSRVQRLVGWRSAELLLERGLVDAWTAMPLLSEQQGLTLLDVGS